MLPQLPADAEVKDWLSTLGVKSLCQWDLLVFLYRHPTTIAGAEHLARLLGYATEPAITALDDLEALGLVVRSRVSQGARLYLFMAPSVPPHRDAFERLLTLVGHRPGRLLLTRQLRPNEQCHQEELPTPRPFVPEASQAAWTQQRKEEKQTWLKAI
jgi:hypothetical protein